MEDEDGSGSVVVLELADGLSAREDGAKVMPRMGREWERGGEERSAEGEGEGRSRCVSVAKREGEGEGKGVSVGGEGYGRRGWGGGEGSVFGG